MNERSRRNISTLTGILFGLAVLVLIVNSYLAFRNTTALAESSRPLSVSSAEPVNPDAAAARDAVHAANYRYAIRGIIVSGLVLLLTCAAGFYLLDRDATNRRRIAEEQQKAAADRQRAVAERELVATEKERFARYNTLILESTGEGIVGTDPSGRCTFINKAAGRLLGIDPESVIGKNFHDFTKPTEADGEPMDPAESPIAHTAREGMPAAGEDLLFHKADGTAFPVQFSASPIRDRGRVAGAVVTFSHNSRRKEDEKEIKEARDAAEAANVAKSQFLANMSHELRTPLNAVILYSELLQEEAEDRGITDFGPDLEKIRIAGKHLLALVNGVLDLSKIEAGKMDLYLETFDLDALLKEVHHRRYADQRVTGFGPPCLWLDAHEREKRQGRSLVDLPPRKSKLLQDDEPLVDQIINARRRAHLILQARALIAVRVFKIHHPLPQRLDKIR